MANCLSVANKAFGRLHSQSCDFADREDAESVADRYRSLPKFDGWQIETREVHGSDKFCIVGRKLR